jgi:adenosylhomocysteinase
MIGIVEDTENGDQKYMAALGIENRQNKQPGGHELPLNFPLVSSARLPPLKESEDALIGLSIVLSAEAELRTRNHILLSETALVLGSGKIGKSLAEALRRRDVDVHVCDINGEKSLQAYSARLQGDHQHPRSPTQGRYAHLCHREQCFGHRGIRKNER